MTERRDPEKTPGEAHLEGDPNDDFTLPAGLYIDAVSFYRDALAALDDRTFEGYARQERYATAAIITVFAGLEAQLNQAAFGHADAHVGELEAISKDVLTEHETSIDDGGRIQRRGRNWPFDKRVQFLVRFLAGRGLDKSSEEWRNLQTARAMRDRCVHPKPPFSRPTVNDAHQALLAVTSFLVMISEMMGVDPPLWLVPDLPGPLPA